MAHRGRATLLPIKASYAKAIRGKKESKDKDKEIRKGLADGSKIKI
ncbi:hypothetical protein [Methanoplanus endosymbiosus]|uniref:Uncharacterized protein n=1 Tax=Methanoplanus endosymbiosus TaxID=33865 RepID=A0A9E7PLU3_9EURY|nr:hypothetical protein [Methanoplanus endosymbiosus]UUX92275.1 hypothetical protein L6E24_13150 [Methanoplanus endosymbiosus]